MSIDAIIGGQWGDEGKGKIVDLLSKNINIVARYQGGANAGHTVYKDDKKIVLHQIPTGALREDCVCVLGNGMVIDPIGILEELQILKNLNISVNNRILIDFYAHIVTPIHKYIDQNNEKITNNKIGTTCKGIGPTYADKYKRIGIRAIDLLDKNLLKTKIRSRLDIAINNNEIEKKQLNAIDTDLQLFYKTCNEIIAFIQDTFPILNNKNNPKILIEGAQGTLLDIDYGTFPYVTSSNCSSGGIGTGLGISGNKLNKIIGIFKAYTTRVGGGPFPTELFDDDGKELGKIGKEFGATTGRPRRCGWFDLVAAKYSATINGLTNIALTKLDILNTFDKIKICVAYKHNDEIVYNMSQVMNCLDKIEPIYKEFDGWNCELENINSLTDFPEAAQNYLNYIQNEMNVPISIISIGPKRNQIVLCNK